MAVICGNLWEFNLTKVVVVDVSDDYELMQPPLPTSCYPVIAELWLPRHGLLDRFPLEPLVDGFLYDWHQRPDAESADWVVGVVRQDVAIPLVELGPHVSIAVLVWPSGRSRLT